LYLLVELGKQIRLLRKDLTRHSPSNASQAYGLQTPSDAIPVVGRHSPSNASQASGLHTPSHAIAT
jgi:hypothetical protein